MAIFRHQKAFSDIYTPTVEKKALLKSGFVFKEQQKKEMHQQVNFFQQSEIQ